MLAESTNQGHNGPGAGRILVVEDERIVARDLADTLKDLGYSVVAMAATGEDAIEKAREHTPSLVLMDIRLAGEMDGVEAAETIATERGIPVIYLSAHADDDTLRRAKCTDPFGYLVKPFKAVELRCAIETALHKHAADALVRARERWLETTLSSIGDAVVATDPEQKIRLMNPVAEALTGWKQAEALGRRLDEVIRLVSGPDRTPLKNPMVRALQQRRTTTLQQDASLVAKPGNLVPVDDSAAPIVTDDGELLGGVMVFRDVRERREAADEIRRLNTEFERRVVERTTELEAANQELEAFSYSVAHDLRTPLSGIDGFSRILAEEHGLNLGPEGMNLLAFVRKSAQRMGELIEDLLRLARVARCDFNRERVELSALARRVVEDLRRAHPRREVHVTIEDGVHVLGNQHLLQIVLENLLGNAWKFTSRVARAHVEFGAREQDGRLICYVTDNGAGFDMARVDELFTPFQRLHAASEFEGTGIGLTIVRRIINRHEGQIWAESSRGLGATFYFTV